MTDVLKKRTEADTKLLHKANSARDVRDWSGAVEYYQKYLVQMPNDWEALVQYGHALKEGGSLNEAEEIYIKAANIFPNSKDTYIHLAHLQKRLGKNDLSIDTFLKVFDLEDKFGEAFRELIDLGYPQSKLRERAIKNGILLSEETPTEKFCFDVSDLIQYFNNARVATGIQRVQIRIIESLIAQDKADRHVSIISYSVKLRGWVQIPNNVFFDLVQIAAEDSDVNDPSWIAARKSFFSLLDSRLPVRFSRGAYLINLGTSWWLRNYFLSVRNAKAEFGIKYVPFVHDCIPALMPEHCVFELTRDFLAWIRGVFAHADYYLCNSEWTRSDLIHMATRIAGRTEIPTSVVRLDGDSRLLTEYHEGQAASVLRKYGLRGQDFVVFVSTIESRKNHLMLFEVWLRLIRELGERKVPKLICVGNRGWKVDSAIRMLNSSDQLREHVIIANGISDNDLRVLYKNCRFTVYPSLYEGWGLPVTESLCYGKPVVSSNSSSLPEAGGDHAIYFDPLNARELHARIHELITDSSALAAAQEKAKSFSPRSWTDIANELQDVLINGLHTADLLSNTHQHFKPELGIAYSFKEDVSGDVVEPRPSAERFRVGNGWSSIDDFGCWLEQQTAELAFSKPDDLEASADLYLLLAGLPQATGRKIDFRVSVNNVVTQKVSVLAGRKKLCRVRVEMRDWLNESLVVTLTSNDSEPLSNHSEGRDSRIAHGGVVEFMLVNTNDFDSRLGFLELLLE
jgi:glycosyltransferase involved in cell wall biosynthesis